MQSISEKPAESFASETSVNENCPLFIQYQSREYTVENIISQIREKCAAENLDATDLKIYVKPEDSKAYFTCAGGNSFITL